MEPKQTHVIDIAAPIDTVWAEVTKLNQIQKPFFGTVLETDFKPGSRLLYRSEDGKRVFILGEVIECDAPRKLIHTFRFVGVKETPTRVEWSLETRGNTTRVTVTHSQFVDQKQTAKAVLTSWPAILGDIKAVVETGDAPWKTRMRNWFMTTFAFMAPKDTLIENQPELRRKDK